MLREPVPGLMDIISPKLTKKHMRQILAEHRDPLTRIMDGEEVPFPPELNDTLGIRLPPTPQE